MKNRYKINASKKPFKIDALKNWCSNLDFTHFNKFPGFLASINKSPQGWMKTAAFFTG